MYLGDDTPTQIRMRCDEELAREMADKLSASRSTRSRRLARIKRAVQSSDYENQLKLSVAIDRLLDKLGPMR